MICHYCCCGYIADGFDVRPCPECGGSGFIHCCEGERPDQCPEHLDKRSTVRFSMAGERQKAFCHFFPMLLKQRRTVRKKYCSHSHDPSLRLYRAVCGVHGVDEDRALPAKGASQLTRE